MGHTRKKNKKNVVPPLQHSSVPERPLEHVRVGVPHGGAGREGGATVGLRDVVPLGAARHGRVTVRGLEGYRIGGGWLLLLLPPLLLLCPRCCPSVKDEGVAAGALM